MFCPQLQIARPWPVPSHLPAVRPSVIPEPPLFLSKEPEFHMAVAEVPLQGAPGALLSTCASFRAMSTFSSLSTVSLLRMVFILEVYAAKELF